MLKLGAALLFFCLLMPSEFPRNRLSGNPLNRTNKPPRSGASGLLGSFPLNGM